MRLPRTEQDFARMGERVATGAMRTILNVSWAFEWLAGRLMLGAAWGLLVFLMALAAFATDDTLIGLVQGERPAAATVVLSVTTALIVWRVLVIDRPRLPKSWRRPPGEGEWW